MINTLLVVCYFISALLQFFAIFTCFSVVYGMNAILSFFIAMVTCGVPFLGTVLGVLGAHEGWGWGWIHSILLFIWPYALFVILMIKNR